MRTWLAVLALAGCRGPTVFECLASTDCSDGAATGTCEPTGFCSFHDASCVSGRRYDATAGMNLAGTCVPAPPAGDLDSDGVLDPMDNCPMVPNAAQDNEDGDRFGDACDPCPAFADGDPLVDSDGDGVTDLCDPHLDPAAPDHVVLFEGFGHGIPASWTATAWTASGGAVHADGDGAVTVATPATFADTYVLVRLDLQSLGAASALFGVTMNGVVCGFQETAPGGNQKLVLHTAAGGNLGALDIAFSTGSYVLTLRWDHVAHWDCTLSDLGSTIATVSGNHVPPGGDTGVVEVGTIAGDVPFVLVVGR